MLMKNKRLNEEQSMKDLMEIFKNKHRLHNGLDKVDVEKAWMTQLGPAIKNYTNDIKFKNQVLTVHLSSSTLREELSYGKDKIIKTLNESLGKELITKLILR
jgi:predicted nucleic acid-binding Zn ribbon protein